MSTDFKYEQVSIEKVRLQFEVDKLNDELAILKPKHQSLERQYQEALNKNTELSNRIDELMVDMSTMRNALIDSSMMEDNGDGLLDISVDGKNMSRSILSNSPSKLGLIANMRRSDGTLQNHVDQLAEQIDENTEQLGRAEERRCME